jgi:hypothetical protein
MKVFDLWEESGKMHRHFQVDRMGSRKVVQASEGVEIAS